ncbi:MAG: 2OG-Fe(II) oxygenase [Candidatus Rokubacteria bacterium]|nr:2OG-Fe(II) oxygenase [Candidatus Rokubacteria bacterium]
MSVSLAERLARLDWARIGTSLDEWGQARTPALLSPSECAELRALYVDDARFRSRVNMARYRFGVGEYKYFSDPLPPVVREIRERAYPPLALIANRWEAALKTRVSHSADLAGLLALCARRGQRKPTPLLLRYEAGGYNCLHQDLYGDVVFPIQLTVLLSEPGKDFEGGEFLLVEQRPRAQSRGSVVRLEQGEAVIFTTRYRPAPGARGHHRVTMRHGVSRVLSGERYTLGVIFHNAA